MFSGWFSRQAVPPSYSRLPDDPAESAPLTRLEAAEASSAKRDADRAEELEQAEARYKDALAALQLKREATAHAHALMVAQADKNLAELTVAREERERAEREAKAATQSTQRPAHGPAQAELNHSKHIDKSAVYTAMYRAVAQRTAVWSDCITAERVAEQQLHAAEQQRAAAQRAKKESAAAAGRARRAASAVRIKQPVLQECKTQ